MMGNVFIFFFFFKCVKVFRVSFFFSLLFICGGWGKARRDRGEGFCDLLWCWDLGLGKGYLLTIWGGKGGGGIRSLLFPSSQARGDCM